MKSRETPIIFYSACYLSEHFFFEGYGPSKETALGSLRGALTNHAFEYGLLVVRGRYPWVEGIIDQMLADDLVQERAFGFGYRDDVKIAEL